MSSATYQIAGGDYDQGGSASKQLKALLKRIGADAKALRRAMIAAYEAEMNCVIHAGGGIMKVAVDPAQVDVSVIDEGPGIPDIKRAMTEGFSTAPAAAREMGFGAGMGLPNIQKNTDRFSIHSSPGHGTQLRFSVVLGPQEVFDTTPNSIHIAAELCRQCLRCLHGCPTAAIRLRAGLPQILGHLCVDCTACLGVCPDRVYGMDCLDALPEATTETVLVTPGALLAQFGPGVEAEAVREALASLGYAKVLLLETWDEALRAAVRDHARVEGTPRPVLSPVCPAVLNLIQMRFPALISHVAPFLTPIEAAREELAVDHAVFVAPCPAHYTVLRAPSVLTRIDVISPAAACNALLPHVKRQAGRGRAGEDAGPARGVLEVSGMHHVLQFLDQAETGLMNDWGVVELYACEQGCFGSPAWRQDAFVARRRFESAAGLGGAIEGAPEIGTAIRRTRPLRPRPGLRLDPDMRKAMEKLAKIDALTKKLPGRDCGVCGAPTCAALAEDTVLGRADTTACIYFDPENEPEAPS